MVPKITNIQLNYKTINFLIIIIIIIIINFTPVSDFIKYKISYKIGPFVKFKIATRNMSLKKFDGFFIYYNGEIKEDNIELIESSIKKAKNNILGVTGTYPLSIVLFSSKADFYSNFSSETYNDTVSIYGNNTIYLCSVDISEHVIIHEYTHYLFDSFCKNKNINSHDIPTWFQEGLAEYNAYLLTKESFNPKSLKKVKSFKELNKPNDSAKAYYDGYDVYTQDHLAVEKIINTNKSTVIQEILIQSKTMNFYDALKKDTGKSIEEYEELIKSSK